MGVTLSDRRSKMHDKERIVEQIVAAFAAVEYPGDWCLRDGNEGDEPYLLEAEFKGKADWRVLDPMFLDQSPVGYGTALSFFSDEAFHFFLPAYMLADIQGQLDRSNPVFHLTHGLDDLSRGERINSRRFGARTWFEHARHRFAILSRDEAAAIVSYLLLMRESDDFERDRVDQALKNYRNERAG
jgi:hypothetical protein